MFCVVRSIDSFNFPLGLIKCIVNDVLRAVNGLTQLPELPECGVTGTVAEPRKNCKSM